MKKSICSKRVFSISRFIIVSWISIIVLSCNQGTVYEDDVQPTPVLNYDYGMVQIFSNEPVHLSLSATVNDGKLTYQWYKANGFNNSNGTIIEGATSNTYTINNLGLHEILNVYCVVTNTIDDNKDGGNKTSKITSEVFTVANSGLPLITINTNNEEMPTYEIPTVPDWYWGKSIVNATKIPARMIMTKDGSTLFDSGEYEQKVSGITIKIRGNASAYEDKKPYKIKLQQKTDLLAHTRSSTDTADHSDKNWILLKDGNSLKTKIGLKVSSLMGFSWTPAYDYVDLVINGKYYGIYMLIESIERSDARIDVKKKGFIIERDVYWYTEDLYFDTPQEKDYYQPVIKYTFKHPDPDDAIAYGDENYNYIKNYVNEAFDSLDDGSYESYLDLNTFASWVLVHDILGTHDGAGSNMYMSKYDQGTSKLKMETPWDFDSIMRIKTDFAAIHNAPFFYYPKLFESDNKAFLNEYKDKWNSQKDTLFVSLQNDLASFEASEAEGVDISRKLDSIVYGYEYRTVSDNVQKANSFFNKKKTFLDREIQNLN